MALLKKLLCKHIKLVVLTVCINISAIAVSLWWNAQLGRIINTINANNVVPAGTIILAVVTILISVGLSYLLSICSGWTCETMAHDLRMGYAVYFSDLSLDEIENLNAGEQVSRLQNEIGDVSGFIRTNLFTFIDDLVKFIATLSWMLWLNPKLTLFANIPTVIIIWYTVCSSRVIGKAVQIRQQANAEMNGFADTLITIFRCLMQTCLFGISTIQHWSNGKVPVYRKKAEEPNLCRCQLYCHAYLCYCLSSLAVLRSLMGQQPLAHYIFSSTFRVMYQA